MRADLASTFLLLALLAGPLTLARAEPPSSKPGSAPGSTAPRRVGDGVVIPDLDEPDSERSAATKKSSAAATSAPGTPPPPATTTPAPPPVVQAIEPPPILQHDPVAWTRPDVPLQLVAKWQTVPSRATDLWLHYRAYGRPPGRPSGQAVFQHVKFGLRNETTFEAEIPAAALTGDAIEYYLSSRPSGADSGPETLHFASPSWPHIVIIAVEDAERTRRGLLAQHIGNHSQFRFSGLYVDRGARTIQSSDGKNRFDSRDYYYRLEGDYTYRILAAVYSIRIGGGVLRGDSFTLAQPLPVRVDNVGLTYGFAEVRFRFGRLVRLDLRATLGAGPNHFDGGGGAQLLIGLDPGTHFAIGGDGVSSVGVRAWVRLAWNTVPHVPMSFTLEASNLPLGQDVGGLMYLTAGYRPSRYMSFDLQLGYAHRDKAVGGPITGLALKFEF